MAEVPLQAAATQFRAAHRHEIFSFANDRQGVCYKVERTYSGVMHSFAFKPETAQFVDIAGTVMAGFYRASLTVDIQIADSRNRAQMLAQEELQRQLEERQQRGELNDVVVLVKNPVNQAWMGWNIQNMLVEIDGVVFVATRHGAIVRPLTDMYGDQNPVTREDFIAAEFLAHRGEIDESHLQTWDTQTCKPAESN